MVTWLGGKDKESKKTGQITDKMKENKEEKINIHKKITLLLKGDLISEDIFNLVPSLNEHSLSSF